jgi:mutator protein MutT
MIRNSNPTPLLAVRAIIEDTDGKILILKRAPDDEYGNMWCLPGGKVDFGQTAEEAIKREVEEETSLECTSAQFLFYMDGLPRSEDEKHYLTLYFSCQVGGNIKLNEESSAFTWLGLEEIGKYSIAFGNEKVIKRFWNDH